MKTFRVPVQVFIEASDAYDAIQKSFELLEELVNQGNSIQSVEVTEDIAEVEQVNS